jgi:hypothetical protein
VRFGRLICGGVVACDGVWLGHFSRRLLESLRLGQFCSTNVMLVVKLWKSPDDRCTHAHMLTCSLNFQHCCLRVSLRMSSECTSTTSTAHLCMHAHMHTMRLAGWQAKRQQADGGKKLGKKNAAHFQRYRQKPLGLEIEREQAREPSKPSKLLETLFNQHSYKAKLNSNSSFGSSLFNSLISNHSQRYRRNLSPSSPR